MLKVDGQEGYYFSGYYTYLDNAPQVFLPAAGNRSTLDGDAYNRGVRVLYWSSRPHGTYAYYLRHNADSSNVGMTDSNRANGYSVRCVQE